jgi:hypothetical protein
MDGSDNKKSDGFKSLINEFDPNVCAGITIY